MLKVLIMPSLPAWLAGFLAIALGSAASGADPDRFEGIREAIRNEIEEGNLPSVAVAVAQRGEIVWEEAFGWADMEKPIAASTDTMYSLASISKPITATALMILVDRGQIDLDRPIEEYLGGVKLREYAGSTGEATVRRVAAHISGLPLHHHFFLRDEAYRRPSMAETIRRYGILVTKPGEKFQYSNLGYGLLEYVIERTSRMGYAEFLRQNVFQPLDMNHSDAPIKPDPGPHRAVRYWKPGAPLPFYDFDHRGGSAVFASVHDLVRFGMFHVGTPSENQQAILPRRRMKEMQQPVSVRIRPRYGIGWRIEQRDGYGVVQHGGSMGGVRTTLTLVPSEQIAVAVLANRTSPFVVRVTEDILTILLARYQKPSGPGGSGRQVVGGVPSGSAPLGSLPRGWTGEWSGHVHTHEGEVPMRLWIAADHTADARIGEQPKRRISRLELKGGYLSGQFPGDIGTSDASRRPHVLLFSLKKRGSRLTGSLAAIGTPGPQISNALTSWVELRRR